MLKGLFLFFLNDRPLWQSFCVISSGPVIFSNNLGQSNVSTIFKSYASIASLDTCLLPRAPEAIKHLYQFILLYFQKLFFRCFRSISPPSPSIPLPEVFSPQSSQSQNTRYIVVPFTVQSFPNESLQIEWSTEGQIILFSNDFLDHPCAKLLFTNSAFCW